MSKRIYFQTILAALLLLTGGGLYYGPDILLYFQYTNYTNYINITSLNIPDGCSSTSWDDPCYVYINFTAINDTAWFPEAHDPWGRNNTLKFDFAVKDWKLQRSWGTGWREIPMDKGCTGTWCGGKRGLKFNKFSVVWRKGKDYSTRISFILNNEYDNVMLHFGELHVVTSPKIGFTYDDKGVWKCGIDGDLFICDSCQDGNCNGKIDLFDKKLGKSPESTITKNLTTGVEIVDRQDKYEAVQFE